KAGVAVLIFLVVAGAAVTILCLVIPDLPGKLSAGLRGDSGEPLSAGKPASHWLNELRDPDAGIRQEAAYNLKLLLAEDRHREALAPKVVPALIAIVRNPNEDPDAKRAAVAALSPCAKLRDDLVPVFLDALHDNSHLVRQQAVLALGEAGCKEDRVIAALMECLLDR